MEIREKSVLAEIRANRESAGHLSTSGFGRALRILSMENTNMNGTVTTSNPYLIVVSKVEPTRRFIQREKVLGSEKQSRENSAVERLTPSLSIPVPC